MSSNTFTQKSSIVPQGFGQPLAPGAILRPGVLNSQVRYANQPLQTKQVYSIPATAPASATGVSVQPGGKRRRRKTTKKRRTKRMRKSRRHR